MTIKGVLAHNLPKEEHPIYINELLKLNGLELWYDKCPSSPFEYNDITQLVAIKTRNYDIGNEQVNDLHEYMFSFCDYEKWGSYEDMVDMLGEDKAQDYIQKRFSKKYYWSWVDMHEHSNVSFSLTDSDSGATSIIMEEKGKVASVGHKKQHEYFANMIAMYTQYMNGEVWGYTIEEDESCGGYYSLTHMTEDIKQCIFLPVEIIKDHLTSMEVRI